MRTNFHLEGRDIAVKFIETDDPGLINHARNSDWENDFLSVDCEVKSINENDFKVEQFLSGILDHYGSFFEINPPNKNLKDFLRGFRAGLKQAAI